MFGRRCHALRRSFSSAGSQAKKPQQREFLSYEEAKKVVQPLGLRSTREWQAWSKTDRPENIPAAPNCVYRDKGWRSFRDFLGSDINERSHVLDLNVAASLLDDLPDVRGGDKNMNIEAAGIAFVQRLLQEAGSEFELTPLPQRCVANVAFTKRDSATFDAFVPLIVKATSGPRAGGEFGFTFTNSGSEQRQSMSVLYTCEKHGRFAVSELTSVPWSAISARTRVTSALDLTRPEDLVARFQKWWREREHHSLVVLGVDLARASSDRLLHTLIAKLVETVYQPEGLKFRFSERTQKIFNAVVGGKRVLHHVAFGSRRVGLRVDFGRNVGGGLRIPHDFSDPFDVVVCLVPDQGSGGLRGFFAFPKSVLRPYRSEGRKLGVSEFLVYPPYLQLKSSRSQAIQAWQAAYYSDLCEANVGDRSSVLRAFRNDDSESK